MFAIKSISIWTLIVSALVALHAQSSAASATASTTPERERAISATKTLVDQLGPTQLQEILSQLRTKYVDPTAVNTQALAQAAFTDLLSQLWPAVRWRVR